MALKRWTRPINEMLATHELFRKMGFKADDLFVRFGANGEMQFELRNQKAEFAINIVGGDSILQPDGRLWEQLRDEWQRAVDWWNGDAPEFERHTLYNGSTIRKEAVGIIMALKNKGIEPPNTLN